MYIHVYGGNPTAGGTDGMLLSEGDGSAPITAKVNATANEVGAWIKQALRTDAGKVTDGNTTITPTGPSADKWQLAPDNAGVAGVPVAYGGTLTIASVIDATNTIFWARAKAVDTETEPTNDASIDLIVNANIAAA